VIHAGHLDLQAATRRALEELRVPEIETISACTACDRTRFFSHRRDNGRTGRQGLVAFIENPAS
jgi:copper oxidase (laccase) domain-containing protein